jgi:hypothetical protein
MNFRYTVASLGLALSLGATAIPMAHAAVHPDPINWPDRATPHPSMGPWLSTRPHRVRADYGQFGGEPFVASRPQQV